MSKLVKGGTGDTERMSDYTRDVQAKLKQDRELKKPSIHERMAEEAAMFVDHYNFFCEECLEDFTSPAYKEVHRFYGDYIVTYRAIHEENEDGEDCGEECIRLVTHRDHDPYYYLSETVNQQRNQYYTELLQHEQYGFETMYGNPFREHDDKLKEKEERIFMRRRKTGLHGESLRSKEELRQFHENL